MQLRNAYASCIMQENDLKNMKSHEIILKKHPPLGLFWVHVSMEEQTLGIYMKSLYVGAIHRANIFSHSFPKAQD